MDRTTDEASARAVNAEPLPFLSVHCYICSHTSLSAQFERPIRNSPLLLRVTDHINPLRRIGRPASRALDELAAAGGGGGPLALNMSAPGAGIGAGGADDVELMQPAAIAVSSKTNTVFVLDTGARAQLYNTCAALYFVFCFASVSCCCRCSRQAPERSATL